MRETSLAAYRELCESGNLSKRRREVADLYVGCLEPQTDSEAAALNMGRTQVRDLASRVSELIRLGVLVEYGQRRCKISGKMARTADLSAHKPVSIKKAPPVFYWIGLDEQNEPLAIRKHPEKPIGFDDGKLIKLKVVSR